MCSQEVGNICFVFSHIYNYTHAIKQDSNKCELFIFVYFFISAIPSTHRLMNQFIQSGEQASIQSEASPYLVSE